MGQKFTQTKLSVVPEVETFLYKYLPQFQFVKNLSESVFLKTALVINEFDGEPLVCKIYFKRDFSDSESKHYFKIVNKLGEIRDTYSIKTSPNVSPILIVFDNLQKAGIIIRQYFSFNLKERMASMPYLTNIEKKWISFQIIYGLMQIHSKGCCHGDIKLENVMLSSAGSAFLCDIAPYKPAYIQQDDVGSFTYYFGTNSSIKSCYLAPERLVDRYELLELANSIYKVTTYMDVFSLGAVIAELFLEDMLFDHPSLLLYKNGKFNLELVLSKIKDKKIVDLLLKMLKVNPNERIDLSECFKFFAEEISPISFPRMLLQLNTVMVSSDYWKPDLRIGLISKHWKQIWKVIYGPECELPKLNHNLNNVILNTLNMDFPFSKYFIENYSILFDLQNDNSLIENSETLPLTKFYENNNSESSLIVVNWILNAILNTSYASSKLVGMEILRIFSTKLPDITKIQIIIPYLVKLLKDSSNLVRFSALNDIISILEMINENELILPSSDYNFFDAYIFPAILELYSSNEPSLILAFANIIDKLTNLEQKFLQITLRSRFHHMKNLSNESITNIGSIKNSFNFHTINSSKDRGEEIIHAYDTDLYEFKTTLFKIIEDILSKNDDLDTQVTLIRKMPNLMLFYGRRETNNFSKFIIAHFNKKDWIIQREILKCIPSLIVTLGETALNQFIVPCMELIINNNLKELKIYEMIHTMHLLLKLEYLETFRAIDLFKKILPYIMHPNLWIRSEVINFASSLISLLSQGEVYTYLRQEFKSYMYMPFVILTTDLLKHVLKEPLSRVIYELESREIDYFFQRNFEDEEAFQLLENLITTGRESSKYNDEPENNPLEAQMVRLRVSMEGINISSIVKKEFIKFTKNYNNEDLRFIERTFIGKLISLSNIMNQNSHVQNNTLSAEYLKLKYIFGALDIVVNDDILSEIDAEGVSTIRELSNREIKDNTQFVANNPIGTRSTSSLNFNKNNITNWKPQGKLLCTLFDHEGSDNPTSQLNAVERLLGLTIENTNKFLSFSSDGQIILWDVIANENDFSVEKIASNKLNTGVVYGRSICSIDQSQFAVASQNSVECYKVEGSRSNFFIENSYQIKNSNDEDEVCCLLANYKSLENRHLIYANQKGKLQIYDLRINKSALNYQIGVQRGLISCMDYSRDDRSILIGTLGGYLLNYDLRLNSVVESFKYNENTPIIGLKSYFPSKSKELDLYSMNINPNFNSYVLIWTAANDHELGLWNLNTLNCDVLMKVNSLQGKEIKPLSLEIPSIYKENSDLREEKLNLDLLSRNFSNLNSNNKSVSKKVVNMSINSEFYSHSNKRLAKLSNLFDVSNVVQVSISPSVIKGSEFSYFESAPYVISAGNDSTIRYWDISKDGLYNNNPTKKSYLINAPNKIDNCVYTTSTYDSTVILQSNETTGSKLPKKDIQTFSEFQNYNGVNFHLGIQNEFDENLEVLKYCTKNSDAAHKNTITDLMTMNFNNANNNNLLISSSWDGTIKLWK